MKVIKQGFELFHLKNRKLDENLKYRFADWYKHSLPPKMEIFYNSFDILRGRMISTTVFMPAENREFNIGQLSYLGNYSEFIGLYDFVSLEESIESMKNSFNPEDKIHQMHVAYIGDCINNRVLMVGIGDKNLDKIYLECSEHFSDGSRMVEVANDIFEFLGKLALLEKENIGLGISGYDKLYKNWGEDFWRIKENNANA
jgi:hypothetical protein